MNYYDILNVSNDATLKEINKSFKTLSLKYHPDVNPDDKYSEEKMKIITEAYSVLSNYEKRVDYDLKLGNKSIVPFSFQEGPLELLDGILCNGLSLLDKTDIPINKSYSRSVKTTSVIEGGVKKTKKITTENGKTSVEEYEKPVLDKLTFF
tara:strand:- start:39 stop:491 length:453 start_codon:yes stop_codon:yes gene_type:complete